MEALATVIGLLVVVVLLIALLGAMMLNRPTTGKLGNIFGPSPSVAPSDELFTPLYPRLIPPPAIGADDLGDLFGVAAHTAAAPGLAPTNSGDAFFAPVAGKIPGTICFITGLPTIECTCPAPTCKKGIAG